MASTLLWLMAVTVTAMRHQDDESLRENHLQVDDVAGDVAKLNWTRAVTPRWSPEDRAQQYPRLPSSMVQLQSGCTSTYQETDKKLGEGAYGAVYEVKKAAAGWGDSLYRLWDSGSAYYAMKVPLEDDEEAEAAAVHEISVMEASTGHQCVNVLPLLEKDPCVDGKKMPNAFVTKLMPYDLDKWQREYEVNMECFQGIYDAVASGLDCMHEAGYLHGDLKPDNVLFESLDSSGCPVGIQLADFGLSHQLGKLQMKFMSADYMTSWHEAGTCFNGRVAKDPFGITKRIKVHGKYKWHYVADKRLDMCSFAMLMYELFERRIPALQETLGKGGCGPMGPERKLMMP